MSVAELPEITTADLNEATERARERLEPLVAPLAESYAGVLRGAGERMAKKLAVNAIAVTAAGKQFLPPDEDEVAGTDLTKAEMKEKSGKAQEEAVVEVAVAFDEEGISFEIEQVFTQDMLDAIGERAAFAADEELRGVYRDVIAEAADEGWSITRASEEIVSKIDGLAEFRADALARTDLNGLANGASVHVATKTIGREATVYKNWRATPDGRTRETHVEANGQSVQVNESFEVGDARLGYPGDPFGPPEEVMNCRCTVTYGSEPGSTVVRAGAYPAGDQQEADMSTTVTEPEAVTADGVIAEETEKRLQTRDPIPWEAVLCVEGEQTEDMRLLERGSIGWRDLPLTLMGMLETSWGHDGAKVTGRIDEIERIVDDLTSTGEFTSAFGIDEIAPLVEDRTVRGVSVDLAVLDYEYRDPDSGEVLSDEEIFDRWWEGEPMLFVVLEGTIVGATVCPMPAIANAEIAIAASAGLDKQARGILASAIEGTKLLPSDIPILRVFTPFDRKARRQSFFAAATVELAAPPRAHFELSEFPGKTPLTVSDPDDAGWRRVFGHLATWETCHVGIPGVCTTAPRSSTSPEYALFHQHHYDIAEGGTLDCGVLMLGTGHASLAASRMEATRHYDKPDMIGAYVRAHDGEHGIWVSGIVRPEITAAGLRELRSNPPSGDWRQYNRALELIAACAVAVPGFPVVASADANLTAAGGEIAITALIASSGQIVPSDAVKEAMIAAGCACEELETSDEGVDDLLALDAD